MIKGRFSMKLGNLAAWCAAVALSACLFETDGPQRNNPTGAAAIQVQAGRIGALAKSSDIRLARLVITLNAPQETSRTDTLSLSGSGEQTINKTYTGLAANKTWTLQARTVDARGTIIHSGTTTFTLQAGRTTPVSLGLSPFYSVLTAWFYPIDDSVSKVELKVDGIVRDDSVFVAQTKVGDTVKLFYDYLSVGSRRIELNVYGVYEGTLRLLYSGDTTVNIAAGQNQNLSVALAWRGPGVFHGSLGMTVTLGALGNVQVRGILNVAKNFPPVFLATGMQAHAAAGVHYRDTLRATDPEGDTLRFTLLQGPAGMTLADSILAWTPTPSSANATVTVAADDGKGGRDTLSWSVTLVPSILAGMISKDTLLSLANSPYWVMGNVLLQPGYTMTIQPGVRLLFEDSRGIQINGRLIARGTASDSIHFVPAAAGMKWARILFSDSSADASYDGSGNYAGGSVLEYCRIEAGGKDVSGMVQMENASPYVHRCLIKGSETRGIVALGIPTLAECSVRENRGGGIQYTNNSVVRGLVSGNLIEANATSDWFDLSGAGIAVSGRASILNNVISKNGTIISHFAQGGGIYSSGNGSLLSGNTVVENYAYYGGGMFSQSSNDSIVGNVFHRNSSQAYAIYGFGNWIGNRIDSNTVVSGYPAFLYSGSFRKNTLKDNRSGDSASAALSISGTFPVNDNNFLNPDLAYEIKNGNSSTTPNINASGNWWGTADEAVIQKRIYDWFDNAASGIVNYTPFLAAPAPAAPVP